MLGDFRVKIIKKKKKVKLEREIYIYLKIEKVEKKFDVWKTIKAICAT